jgi:WD40 repeat protein/energy-coupling factor transporter ATP-binding protein EcfA2
MNNNSKFPYPGTRPFKRDEHEIFFGRQEFVDRLVEKLQKQHFIAVVGDSGCGKSSLIRAGLLASSTEITIKKCVDPRVALMRPGNSPFDNLSRALLKEAKTLRKTDWFNRKAFSQGNEETAVIDLQKTLRGNLERSYQELERCLDGGEYSLLMIIVDQFEELFRYSPPEEAERFIQWLLACSYHAKSKIYVVITMRSEFLDECATHESLIAAINEGFFQIPHLTRDQLKETIELPARGCEGEVEPQLVERLLTDIDKMGKTSRPDQLPLLQYALVQMWLKVNASPQKVLTVQHYEGAGGNLAAVLTQTADQTYNEASDSEKRIIEILLRRLSQKDEKGNYTRHPVTLQEVANLAAVTGQLVSTIADKFQKPEHDFLFAQNKPPQGYLRTDSIVDIRHESIIRQWERLRHWTDEEASWVRTYKRWEDAAQQWKDGKGELRRGRYLESNEAFLKETQRLYPTPQQLKLWASRYGQDFDLVWEFLEKSREAWKKEQAEADAAKQRELEQRVVFAQKQRELNLWRWVTGIAVAGVVGIAVSAVWIYLERSKVLQSEQARTESLFESYRRHSALLAQSGNYAEAQQILKQSYPLDDKIVAAPRHARNLLARFIDIMNGQPQRDYLGAKVPLYSLALSPDQKTIAAVGEEGSVVLFDIDKGTLLKRLSGHTKHVRAVAFHPQTQWLATAGDDKQIILWSLATGQLLKQWQTTEEVWALAVNSTGELLASGGRDKQITLWTANGESQATLTAHTDSVKSLAFSPDNTWLASASYDNTVGLWQKANDNTWQLKYTLKAHTDHVQEVAFSPKGDLLATASDDGTVRLWDVNTGNHTKVLRGHQDKVFTVRFLNDHALMSGSADSSLRLWDVANGVTMRVLQGHTASVTGLVTAGARVLSSSIDTTIKQWDTTLPYQHTFNLPASPTATAIAPDGQRMAVGFDNGSLELRKLPTGELIATQEKVHSRDIQRLAFSPDNHWLASASLDTTAKLWQVQGDKLTLSTPIQHQAGVNAVTFSPDNQTLLTASYDGQLGMLKLDTQKISYSSLYPKDMNSVVLDDKGEYVLTTSDNQAYLWKTGEYQKPLVTYPETLGGTWWAALSPDAQQVAVVGRYFVINLYPKNEPPYTLAGHKDSVLRAMFSPDSAQLATVGGDNTVRMWDLLQHSELFTLTLPTSGKNVVWDFDFRCTGTEQHCWITVPLTKNKQVVVYELGKY